MNYAGLLNGLNKAGLCHLHHEGLNQYMDSENWSMLIFCREDECLLYVLPHHLLGIDTREEDEEIGLIRMEDVNGDDIDFNYWYPVMITVDGVVTHKEDNSQPLLFGGNLTGFDPLPFEYKENNG